MKTQSVETFGFIGLGDMGGPMAANLCRDGLPLVVYDIRPDVVVPAESATQAANLEQLAAACSVVFVSVPDGVASLQVIEQLLAAPHSRLKSVINLSTVGITDCDRIMQAVSAGSFEYIDAPVSGGRSGAVNGTVTLLWSGSKTLFEELQDELVLFAKSLIYVGEKPGQGQALKLLNNFLSGVALTATSEAVRFGLHHGIDMKTILDAVHVSTGQNVAISDKFPKRVLTQTYDAGFKMSLMEKDISLYLANVEEAGLPSAISEKVAAYWKDGLARYPDGDFTEIFKVIDSAK